MKKATFKKICKEWNLEQRYDELVNNFSCGSDYFRELFTDEEWWDLICFNLPAGKDCIQNFMDICED